MIGDSRLAPRYGRRMPRHRDVPLALAVLVLSGCAADLGAASAVVPGPVAAGAVSVGSVQGGTAEAACGDPFGDAAGAVDLGAVRVGPVGDRVSVAWTWEGSPPSGVESTLSVVLSDAGAGQRSLVVALDGDEVTSLGVEANGVAGPVVGELVGSGQRLEVLVDPAALGGLVAAGARWHAVVAVDGVASDRCPDA